MWLAVRRAARSTARPGLRRGRGVLSGATPCTAFPCAPAYPFSPKLPASSWSLLPRRRALHAGRPTAAAAAAPQRKGPRQNDPPRPAVDSTSLFRFANPELFLDPKSPRTWYIVGAVWAAAGGAYAILRYQEWKEELAADEKLRLQEELMVGPARRPQSSKFR